MIRSKDAGVVLVTILVVMALCVTVIVAMTLRSEQAIRVTGRDRDATQARALLSAGEASAVSALILDLQTAPEADGPGEAWATIGQTDLTLRNGTFHLSIRDEAAWFNLNTLIEGSPTSRQALVLIVAAAGLPPEVAVRIAAAMKGGKPLLQNQDLAPRAVLTPAEIAALSAFVTCTSETTGSININSAPDSLLTALLRNSDTTSKIIAERKLGLITPDVLRQMGVILPAGLALTSDIFGLTIVTSSGDATVRAGLLIHRWRSKDGMAHAVVTARKLETVSQDGLAG